MTRHVKRIRLNDNRLPWYAKGLEGQEFDVLGTHYLGKYFSRKIYVIEREIPDSDKFMFFETTHCQVVQS